MKLRNRAYVVIFGTETRAGKWFDLTLIVCIVVSVLVLMLESVSWIRQEYGIYLKGIEWFLTGLFTLEYLFRLYAAPSAWRYMRSFYGIVDLLAVLPTFLSLLIGPANHLLIIRLLRVMRIFRVLKLVPYLTEANTLGRSIAQSRRKIAIFFVGVLVLCVVFGSIMYLVEGPKHGFTSIPKSIYWTIVTITTVGYGDITPQTIVGQIVSSAAMLTGYSILAVPTGIITAELSQEIAREKSSISCSNCAKHGHDIDANYCRQCGFHLRGGDELDDASRHLNQP